MGIDAQRGRRCAAGALLFLALALRPASAAPWPARAIADPPAAPPAASPGGPPPAIPVPLVVGSAADALATLAALEERARADAELDRVERALPVEERAVARLRSDAAAAPGAPAADLAAIEGDLARAEDDLAALEAVTTGRARQLQGASAEVARLRAVWAATAAAPELGGAPERVRARVAEVIRRVAEVDEALSRYLLRLVELQDRVATARADVRGMSGRIARARRDEDLLLFEAESAPLWRALRSVPPSRDASRTRSTARAHATSLREHLVAGDPGTWWQLAFLAALALALAALRRAPGASALDAAVLRHPFLAAAVPALAMTPVFQPAAPAPLFNVAVLAAAVPWVLVTRPLVPRPLVAPQLVLTALFVVDRLAALAPPHALYARLLLLATAIAAGALVAGGVRRGGWASAFGGDRRGRAVRAALWAALALLAISALANVLGDVSLATRLARGTLTTAMAALLAAGAHRIARAAIAAALRLPSVQRRPIVAVHGDLVRRRVEALARWGALALWCWVAALAFRVYAPARDAAAAALGRRLTVGNLQLSPGDVAAFAVTLWIAVSLARLLRFVLDEGVLPSLPLARGLAGAISKTAQYAVVGVGLLAALYASGLELTRFSLFAGTLGVGIGFGLQNVVNNFVSGLILLYERPVQPGDVVEVGKVVGEVRRIGVRSSTVRTFDGADVIVPNGTIIASEVVNWTLADRTRRADVAVSVAYGTDPAAVRRILLAAVDRADVLRRPEPVVLLARLGDSALEFEVRFWPERIDTWVVVASEVRETILLELGRAGISIPFPQRDLHLRSAPPATALGDVARALAPNAARPADAARDRSPPEPTTVAHPNQHRRNR
jgi:small-conductance mechanosensitive channel